MKKFEIFLEELSDGSLHVVLSLKHSIGSKTLGTFSGTVDDIMSKCGKALKEASE